MDSFCRRASANLWLLQRFSGLSHMRQCGEDVLRMLVTGGPPVRGGGGMPQRIVSISVPWSVLRMTDAPLGRPAVG